MAKDVVKAGTTDLAVPSELQGAWGTEGISNADILIPRILLMQGQSDAVGTGKAALGDIARSTTMQVLAKKGEAVDFIPLMSFKTWVESEKVGDKFEYRREYPGTPQNEGQDLEFTAKDSKTGRADVAWRRDRAINLYVLLTTDLLRADRAREAMEKGQMPGADDAVVPCLLSFRRTSYRAGRQMLTFFKACEQFRTPAASGVYRLFSTLEQGNLGNYFVFNVAQQGKSTIDQLRTAKQWYDLLHTAKYNVDAPEVVDDAAPAVPVDGKETF